MASGTRFVFASLLTILVSAGSAMAYAPYGKVTATLTPPHTFFEANIVDFDNDYLIYRWGATPCGSWQPGTDMTPGYNSRLATWYHGDGIGSLSYKGQAACDHTGGTNAGNHPGTFILLVSEGRSCPLLAGCPTGPPILRCIVVGPESQVVPCESLAWGDKRCKAPGGDTAQAAKAPHVICGTADNDKLTGTNGNDLIIAGGGKDKVVGGKGNDIVEGGPGNDTLSGGKGRDRLIGGKGSDNCAGSTDREVSC